MTHSAVDWLLVIIGFITIGTMFLIPWAVVLEDVIERRRGQEGANSIGTMVCIFLCIFEIAALVDWIFGNTSRFM